MKAVRFTRHGKPDVLSVEDVPDPAAGDGEAVVRIEAASINPSDVKNVAGAMEQTTLPRTPGRDFAGIVEAGPASWIGAEVWGTGGDTGFTRDGSHAECIVIPVASLRRKPSVLDFDEAASVGVNFITAWKGLIEGAGLHAGETVLIIAASGGVGNAAVQIARRIDARIIGVDRRGPRPGAAISQAGLSLVADTAAIPEAVREATDGYGADVVLDCVGGVMFRHAVDCLAPRGRLVEMSVAGAREVSFNLADFYHNESRLIGIDTLKLDLTASATVLEALRPGFEAGDYRPAPIVRRLALDDAVAAYQAVAGGEQGRVVLRPRE
ncbi:zinc-binding alcohol dehydrogenase family protein [Acidisphaera sp. S103]|uniref:quinone oxidoreductase family protein n=1 Tax=Acidisphaera sp. S103 TaxID=1747223 RepID=UPI00131DC1FA|nr:zinc-binding alcohol dehydrogenase family protein [Acidisphaera sp. S103]